jgi:hypothetical protein
MRMIMKMRLDLSGDFNDFNPSNFNLSLKIYDNNNTVKFNDTFTSLRDVEGRLGIDPT